MYDFFCYSITFSSYFFFKLCVRVFLLLFQKNVVVWPWGAVCLTFCVRCYYYFFTGPVCLLIVFRWSAAPATQDELFCLVGWAVWSLPLCPGPFGEFDHELGDETIDFLFFSFYFWLGLYRLLDCVLCCCFILWKINFGKKKEKEKFRSLLVYRLFKKKGEWHRKSVPPRHLAAGFQQMRERLFTCVQNFCGVCTQLSFTVTTVHGAPYLLFSEQKENDT